MRTARAFFLSWLQAGKGRWFSLLLLALACLVMSQFENTALRHAQFGRYQQWEPRPRVGKPAVVVSIDSRSIEKFGQWPWPRTIMAQLLERIHSHHPKAVGIDVLFSEPDQYSPTLLRQRFPALDQKALESIPNPDAALARGLASGPTALAVVGVTNPLPGAGLPMRSPPIADGGDIEKFAARYSAALTSLPSLEKAARGEGLINAPQDTLTSTQERGVLRRVPAVAVIDFVPLLSLPLEMARISFGEGGQVAVDINDEGIERVWVGGYSVPTLPNGEILLHFGKPQADYYLSAADVLEGNYPADAFADRFVFIGFNAIAVQDRVVTPLGDNLPGVDIHVQALESLLEGQALRRPAWVRRAEILLLGLWGLFMIAVFPILRPRQATLSMAGVALLTIGSGYAVFHFFRILFDGPSIVLMLAPVFIALLSSTLIAADRRRRQAERELQAGREAAARVAGELDAARRIQMGLLPDPAAVFAAERRYTVAALVEPARAVGGDYYDCFALDERRLCIAVGDVSGKGIPASLFMSMSKTLTGALARRNADLSQAVRAVEMELNRNNPQFLFVTAWVGVLDAETGDLEYLCAGHDAPLLERRGEVRPIDVAAISGPPLCTVEEYPYESATLRMQPGDTLCLFTDGVTEAGPRTDDKVELFGNQRLAQSLAATAGEQNLAARLAALREDVRRFEAGAPPYDDLTLLLLRFNLKTVKGER